MAWLVGLFCAAVLGLAAAFHLYWGAGGKLGVGVSLPLERDGTPIGQPGRLATAAAGAVLLVVMLATLAVFGLVTLPIPAPLVRVFVAGWAALLLARALSWHRAFGLFKTIRTTRFATFDTWAYSPLCLLLALGLAYGAFAAGP